MQRQIALSVAIIGTFALPAEETSAQPVAKTSAPPSLEFELAYDIKLHKHADRLAEAGAPPPAFPTLPLELHVQAADGYVGWVGQIQREPVSAEPGWYSGPGLYFVELSHARTGLVARTVLQVEEADRIRVVIHHDLSHPTGGGPPLAVVDLVELQTERGDDSWHHPVELAVSSPAGVPPEFVVTNRGAEPIYASPYNPQIFYGQLDYWDGQRWTDVGPISSGCGWRVHNRPLGPGKSSHVRMNQYGDLSYLTPDDYRISIMYAELTVHPPAQGSTVPVQHWMQRRVYYEFTHH